MPERFYTPDSLAGPAARLEGSEARHLLRVLRLTLGDEVELFDGRGRAALAEITACSKNSVELSIRQPPDSPATADRPIELAAAVPKSDRFRWLVEKATELGVERLLPLRTARSVVDPGSGKLDKMRQTVISACKQSGRNRLMEIEPLSTWSELVSREFAGKTAIVAHPSGKPLRPILSAFGGDRRLLLVVGPEGGLTDDEIEQAADAGATVVSLGENVLRIETAAIALAAACRLLSPDS